MIPASEAVIEEKKMVAPLYENGYAINIHGKESFVTISTPLYTATLTNRSGGSFVNYTLLGENSGKLKYLGGYGSDGSFHPDLPVSIIMPSRENCMPCLAYFDDAGDNYHFINQPFTLLNSSSFIDTIFLDFTDSVELKYALLGPGGGTLIEKSVVFSADKYINNHFFTIYDDLISYIL